MAEDNLQFTCNTENGGIDYGSSRYHGPHSAQLFSLRTGAGTSRRNGGSDVTLASKASSNGEDQAAGSPGGNVFTRCLQRLCNRNDEASEELLESESRPRRTLSTFTGVFAPVAMSMFSTVLFMRAGFLVGQAGLLEAILQMVLAYTILLLTVLSICAISTNGAVEGGGAYYMISRSLGPEFGGSIGFVFYIANVLSCALYVTGVVEGIELNFGVGGNVMTKDEGLPIGAHTWWSYLYASCVLFVCLIVCLVGGAMFAKTSAAILLVTVICLLSVYVSIFATNHTIQVGIPKENHLHHEVNHSLENTTIKFNYTGLSSRTFRDNLYPDFSKDYSTGKIMNFATVFAVLFSSVTGIMNGANMSGELKDPSKSIPKGTLVAVAFTFTTYIIEVILIGGSSTRELLINNYIFLQQVNLWPPFVLIGVFATTLSAALGNLIGASRILEALAQDQLFWIFLKPATITTKGGNPIVSVLITWILVQLILMVGSLNAIAPITSVFFLLSYASTNLACMALDLASAPNFRPTFKFFSWHTSLLGLIGCMVMCFLISPLYSSIAIIIMLLLIILLHFRSFPTPWGQISQALIFHQVRKYLLMLDIRKAHVKYWRPQILLLVSNPRQVAELMEFVNDIKKGGLYVIGHVKVGNLDEYPDNDPLVKEYPKWLKLVELLKLKAFVEMVLTPSVADGMHHLVRLAGLGGMKVNTVCLGFYDNSTPVDSLAKRHVQKRKLFRTVDSEAFLDVGDIFRKVRDPSGPRDITEEQYVKLIVDALKLQKNVCLFRHFNQLDKTAILHSKGTIYIDVWPVNFFRPETSSYFDNTCLFLLQMACIINMVPGWKSKTCLRVFLFVNAQTENTLQKEQKLEGFLRQLRILAKIQIVSWDSISLTMPPEFDMSINYAESRMQEFNETSEEFLSAVNQLIISYSSRTQVTFLYLPRPPYKLEMHKTYLKQIQGLTEGLPPTVLVHGLHPVTSTTL